MAVRDMTSYFSDSELDVYNDKYIKEIDGVTYYFKSNDTIYNELLVCEIYKLLGMDVVDLELVNIDGALYTMSKCYRDDNKVYIGGYELFDSYLDSLSEEEKEFRNINPILSDCGTEYLFPYNSLETIWEILETKNLSPENIRNIMVDFIKLYSLTILLGDIDFHPGNWEFELDGKEIRLVPKYDNGYAFNSLNDINSFFVDPSDVTNTSIKSLEYFLSISSYEDRAIFEELYYKCNEALFNKAMYLVDSKYGEDLKDYFENNCARFSKGYILRRFNKTRDEIGDLKFEMDINGR